MVPTRRRPTRPSSRRPKRRPSAAFRRTNAAQPPRAVEAFYVRAILRANECFGNVLRRVLFPKLARFAKQEDETKLDAGPEDDVDDVMGSLRSAVESAFNEDTFKRDTETAAKRALKHSQNEFRRLGINLLKAEPKFGKLIADWRTANVDRIKSVHADQLGKVETILREGGNRRVESLQKALLERIDVSASRAELIARDQVLTLNAQITRERHASAGITEFLWTTSNDERVRDSHKDLDGQQFEYADPPIVDEEPALPGEPVQCRCIAFPVLPELEENE